MMDISGFILGMIVFTTLELVIITAILKKFVDNYKTAWIWFLIPKIIIFCNFIDEPSEYNNCIAYDFKALWHLFRFFIVFSIFVKIYKAIKYRVRTVKEVMTCPKCAATYKSGPFYCKACGTKLVSNIENQQISYISQIKCPKCKSVFADTLKECPTCKEVVTDKFEKAGEIEEPVVKPVAFYLGDEDIMLDKIISTELGNKGVNASKFNISSVRRKKDILIILLGIVILVSSLLFVFNYPVYLPIIVFIVGLITFIILYVNVSPFKDVRKKIKKSPDKDINEIVDEEIATVGASIFPNYVKIMLTSFLGIFIPMIIFFNPVLLYKPYGDGYMVYKYTKGITKEKTLFIPDVFKDKPVLAIGYQAFKNSKASGYVLPETIESIEAGAFANNVNLKEIVIPKKVVEIRAEAFMGCSKLEKVVLSEGITDIRASAFEGDTLLTDISLPNSLETLGANAFKDCASLKKITIPKKVVEINGGVFMNCSSLEEVILHDDIVAIHGEVFMNCTSLTKIKLPKKIAEIRGDTFSNCSSLKEINIPYGVTRIGGHAFEDCSSLEKVTIPSTVIEIGSSAFRRCYALEKVSIPYKTSVNERAFKETYARIYRY